MGMKNDKTAAELAAEEWANASGEGEVDETGDKKEAPVTEVVPEEKPVEEVPPVVEAPVEDKPEEQVTTE